MKASGPHSLRQVARRRARQRRAKHDQWHNNNRHSRRHNRHNSARRRRRRRREALFERLDRHAQAHSVPSVLTSSCRVSKSGGNAAGNPPLLFPRERERARERERERERSLGRVPDALRFETLHPEPLHALSLRKETLARVEEQASQAGRAAVWGPGRVPDSFGRLRRFGGVGVSCISRFFVKNSRVEF